MTRELNKDIVRTEVVRAIEAALPLAAPAADFMILAHIVLASLAKVSTRDTELVRRARQDLVTSLRRLISRPQEPS